jgi:hypothetical protein
MRDGYEYPKHMECVSQMVVRGHKYLENCMGVRRDSLVIVRVSLTSDTLQAILSLIGGEYKA